MQPFTLLLLLPILIGIVAYLAFHDVRNAAGAAMAGTALALYGALYALDPSGTWNWLAGLLVLPLPVSLALAAVVLMHGRLQRRRRHGRSHG
jgi:hypothetical protein